MSGLRGLIGSANSSSSVSLVWVAGGGGGGGAATACVSPPRTASRDATLLVSAPVLNAVVSFLPGGGGSRFGIYWLC